jgi:hypothetical protein
MRGRAAAHAAGHERTDVFFFFLSGNRTDCMAAVLPPAAAAQTVLTDGWTCSTERRTVWYGMPAGLAWLNTAPIPSSLLKDKQWHTR